MSKVEVSRKETALALQGISQILGKAAEGVIPADRALREIEDHLASLNIKPGRKCIGEAHTNPHVDNCGVCLNSAGSWGWNVDHVKVK